jgi:hypothetical protein
MKMKKKTTTKSKVAPKRKSVDVKRSPAPKTPAPKTPAAKTPAAPNRAPADGSIPDFLKRETARNAPALVNASAPAQPKPQNKAEQLMAMLAKANGKSPPAPAKAAPVVVAKVAPRPAPAPVVSRPAPGTQLTAATIRAGMQVRIRDKNGAPSSKVYVILPREDFDRVPDGYYPYHEEYAAPIEDIVAA